MREGFTLDGKVALITGGSRGIGRAIAQAFADAGADIVIMSRSRSDLEAVAHTIRNDYGRRCVIIPGDVSRTDEVESTVSHAMKVFERIDILVNNAGVSPVYTKVVNITEEDWRSTMDVNLTGTFLMSKAVGHLMIQAGSGSVINITSIGARVALVRLGAYCASKAGIEALTRVLAMEWVEYGIRVNAIGPAFLATDMSLGLRNHEYFSSKLLSQTPMGRFGDPEDIVGAALYLASDASAYVTGQTLFVDGGWLAR